MTTNNDPICSLNAVAVSLIDLTAKLDREQRSLAEQMAVLQEAGLIYATEHMKDGKYLVLLYPHKTGEARRREYVGKDPQRVQEARNGIQRAKDYDRLQERAKWLNSALYDGLSKLEDAAQILSRARACIA